MPDFSGKSVLDVGCAEGFFSFYAEQHGARRVVAVDVSHGATHRFLLAREYLGSQVEHHLMDVCELSPDQLGTFDIVLLLGVIYHALHPALALEKVKVMVSQDGLAVVETHVVGVPYGVPEAIPLIRFWPGCELNDDPTSWRRPNGLCMRNLLEA